VFSQYLAAGSADSHAIVLQAGEDEHLDSDYIPAVSSRVGIAGTPLSRRPGLGESRGRSQEKRSKTEHGAFHVL
jgi:hypothetical protein